MQPRLPPQPFPNDAKSSGKGSHRWSDRIQPADIAGYRAAKDTELETYIYAITIFEFHIHHLWFLGHVSVERTQYQCTTTSRHTKITINVTDNFGIQSLEATAFV